MTAPSPAIAGKSFEDLKQTNEYGAEYWSARTLQPLLGYSQWRRFEQAIERAITSCKQSGNPPEHHFAGAGKMVDLGSGSVRDVDDYHLSRFACYLIAQNGDPRKPEIAHAQKYFAIQTRRQELSDQAAADLERLELRKQTAEEFKALSGAAQQAGVQNRMFGVFHIRSQSRARPYKTTRNPHNVALGAPSRRARRRLLPACGEGCCSAVGTGSLGISCDATFTI
ncbi:hypothetical protein AGMMS49960_01650 [Betaproteobacteria bacterium]|nr:hypothetical protein AGMMS49543_24620 [Betaproteobacteria bacterium]GHT98491.1 hypothetical protein AGMMS49960_01650 [Betaproteobacteria bacterium]GHU16855.1 hypothetical protein AGMMS50243_03990 [Betaproteobacteria bacterium]